MIVQYAINGLIEGVLFAVLAMGFALVYNTTRIFHVVSASLYVLSAFLLYQFTHWFQTVPVFILGLFVMIMVAILNLLIDVFVYRPLSRRGASNNILMIVSIGLMTIITNLVSVIWQDCPRFISDKHFVIELGSIVISSPQAVQFAFGVSALCLFCLFLRRTTFGVQLRAYSDDQTVFATMGINPNRIRAFSFLFGGVFVAMSGCLKAYDACFDPQVGMNALITAMVAMIIGGIGRFEACLWGGILLGLCRGLSQCFLSAQWQDAIVFGVLILFLFLRPQGIAGIKLRSI